MPDFHRLFKFGGGTRPPWNSTSAQPRSSAIMKIIFGGFAGAVGLGRANENIAVANTNEAILMHVS